MNDLIYYKDSGVKTGNGILIGLLILFFANILPATGYALFVTYFPVIYVNFFVLTGLFFITAFIARSSIKLSKIRDPKTKIILAGASGLFTIGLSFSKT